MSRLAERYLSARRDPERVVLEGFHAIKHALRFGAEILDVRASDPEGLARMAGRLAPDLEPWLRRGAQRIGPDELRELVPRVPGTGVVALARRPGIDPEALLADPADAPLVLLEDPTHLGNLGAVVRVAAAAGCAGVLATGRQDPWHPDAVRGAAGLQFACPAARWEVPVDGPATGGSGRPVVGLDPDGEPWTDPLPRRTLLAFGSERKGLSRELSDRCSRRIALPMRPGVSSLNLATSVAAVLYLVAAGAVPADDPFEGPSGGTA